MELVDIYNDKHEKLSYVKDRKKLDDGEFRLSCFVWIINDNDEILIQQRLATDSCPNMWETCSGGAVKGDNALTGTIRELKEELGIDAKLKDMKFIGSFARVKDFVEVFLLKSNVNIKDLHLQKEEVCDAKWVTIKEFEKLIKDDKACDTSFDVFKKYYDNYYNRYLIFVDGKPVFKKKGN